MIHANIVLANQPRCVNYVDSLELIPSDILECKQWLGFNGSSNCGVATFVYGLLKETRSGWQLEHIERGFDMV